MAFEGIHLIFVGLAICFLSGSVSGHEKELKKIDSCSCSTDTGIIDLKKLAGTEGRPRFFLNSSNNAKLSFSWNPCDPYSLNGSACKNVAACLKQKAGNTSEYYSVAIQDTAEFYHKEDGENYLEYTGTAFNRTSVFSVLLKCETKEEGRVESVTANITENFYETVLYSKYACPSSPSSPSSPSGLSDLGTVALISGVFILGAVIVAFLVFVVVLRSKLPDGVPKPSMCTSMKVALGMILAKCCPCLKSPDYAKVP